MRTTWLGGRCSCPDLVTFGAYLPCMQKCCQDPDIGGDAFAAESVQEAS